jgi:hypothetical protein
MEREIACGQMGLSPKCKFMLTYCVVFVIVAEKSL